MALPGARIVARICDLMGLPVFLTYFFAGAWVVGLAFMARQLWRERAHFDPAPLDRSRPAAVAAAWRAVGALLLAFWLGADLNDGRAAGIFSAAIDWPSRALFAAAFLFARLKV